ncbi:MAG: hypothetical protein HYU73_08885 [Betaproteobacteria bacterium]|nr:hypothetical protein [Betaproteobacteria bacterium]
MMRAGHRTGWLLLLALCVLPPWRVAPAQQAADVPYVSTPSNVVAAMLEMARVTTGDYLIDLGSGDGRIVIEAAKKNGARIHGEPGGQAPERRRSGHVRAGQSVRRRSQ